MTRELVGLFKPASALNPKPQTLHPKLYTRLGPPAVGSIQRKPRHLLHFDRKDFIFLLRLRRLLHSYSGSDSSTAATYAYPCFFYWFLFGGRSRKTRAFGFRAVLCFGACAADWLGGSGMNLNHPKP